MMVEARIASIVRLIYYLSTKIINCDNNDTERYRGKEKKNKKNFVRLNKNKITVDIRDKHTTNNIPIWVQKDADKMKIQVSSRRRIKNEETTSINW